MSKRCYEGIGCEDFVRGQRSACNAVLTLSKKDDNIGMFLSHAKETTMRILTVLIGLLFTMQVFAATETVATITKTTTLTSIDAKEFSKVFGDHFNSDKKISFKCKNENCKIKATISGFSGKIAKQLLRDRKTAVFESQDKTFKLNCGHTKVAFCNLTQKNAVLAP